MHKHHITLTHHIMTGTCVWSAKWWMYTPLCSVKPLHTWFKSKLSDVIYIKIGHSINKFDHLLFNGDFFKGLNMIKILNQYICFSKTIFNWNWQKTIPSLFDILGCIHLVSRIAISNTSRSSSKVGSLNLQNFLIAFRKIVRAQHISQRKEFVPCLQSINYSLVIWSLLTDAVWWQEVNLNAIFLQTIEMP